MRETRKWINYELTVLSLHGLPKKRDLGPSPAILRGSVTVLLMTTPKLVWLTSNTGRVHTCLDLGPMSFPVYPFTSDSVEHWTLYFVFEKKALSLTADFLTRVTCGHGRMYCDVVEMNGICCHLTVSAKALNELSRGWSPWTSESELNLGPQHIIDFLFKFTFQFLG